MTNQISENNKRIAKNTLLLYFRMLFTMAVSLCTSCIGKMPKFSIHHHTNTSKFVVCIYGSAIERFYDEQGNETKVDFQIAIRRKCVK